MFSDFAKNYIVSKNKAVQSQQDTTNLGLYLSYLLSKENTLHYFSVYGYALLQVVSAAGSWRLGDC